MRRLAAAGGTLAMLATDQRPPIMAMIRERTGRAATFAEIAEAKRMLVAALGGSASAVLTDPVWGYAASFAELSPGRGLIVTLDDHEYEEGPGGRRSAAIAGWSAEKIRRLGADAVKLLAWYRPDAAPEVIAHQRAFVAEAGEACRAADIPFVLESVDLSVRARAGGGCGVWERCRAASGAGAGLDPAVRRGWGGSLEARMPGGGGEPAGCGREGGGIPRRRCSTGWGR